MKLSNILMKTEKEIAENQFPEHTGCKLESFINHILLMNFIQYIKYFCDSFRITIVCKDRTEHSANSCGIKIINAS
jgi:AMP nucleosidase